MLPTNTVLLKFVIVSFGGLATVSRLGTIRILSQTSNSQYKQGQYWKMANNLDPFWGEILNEPTLLLTRSKYAHPRALKKGVSLSTLTKIYNSNLPLSSFSSPHISIVPRSFGNPIWASTLPFSCRPDRQDWEKYEKRDLKIEFRIFWTLLGYMPIPVGKTRAN